MSSGSSYIVCPRCGNPAYFESNTRLPEDFLSCRFCGYSVGRKIDGAKWIDGQPPPEPEFYERKAAGAYFILAKTGVGKWGGIELKGNSPRDWKEVTDSFEGILNDPDVDSSESYLTRWDEENKRIINLFGAPKRSVDECPDDCPEKCWEKYPEEGPEKCLRESVGTLPEETEVR